MLNLGNEQLITTPTSNMQPELSRVGSEENLRANHLNLGKVGMPHHIFTSQAQNRWTDKWHQT